MLRPPRLTPARDARIAMRRLPRRGARAVAVALALRAAPRSGWGPDERRLCFLRPPPPALAFWLRYLGAFALRRSGLMAFTSHALQKGWFGWPSVSAPYYGKRQKFDLEAKLFHKVNLKVFHQYDL